MTTNLSALDASRAALNRLPFLAGAALHFHLKEELEKLWKQESWQRSTGRSSRTLAKVSGFSHRLGPYEARFEDERASRRWPSFSSVASG
jgi:hypothetical protein